jgi:hypothetical protein
MIQMPERYLYLKADAQLAKPVDINPLQHHDDQEEGKTQVNAKGGPTDEEVKQMANNDGNADQRQHDPSKVAASKIRQGWTGNDGFKVQSTWKLFVKTRGETQSILRRRVHLEFVFDLSPRELGPEVHVPRIEGGCLF